MTSFRSWGAVVGAAALVAAAIAAPVVLSSDDGDGPAAGSRAVDGPLALGDLPVGAEPAGGHLSGKEFREGTDRVAFTLDAGVEVAALLALADGYLLTAVPDEMGEARTYALDADGAVVGEWGNGVDSPDSGPVASADGRLGAFVAGGKAVVVQDGGRTATELAVPESDLGLPLTAVSVSGTDCTGADADCAVLVKRWEPVGDGGPPGSTWMARPGRAPVPVDRGIADVDVVAADGLTAGTVEIIEDGDGSCAGVADTSKTVLWTTCRDRLISFSPGSRSVLAGTSTSSGSGDHELTVLDARSGEERLRLETADEVGIFEMVWEDDEHVLAVVGDWREDAATGDHVDRRWAVIRIGLDGTREYAVEPLAGEDDDHDGPLDLPQR